MMKPVIGVTPSYDAEHARYQLNRDYMEAVLRAGGVPLILPLTGDETVLETALAGLDGVVFTGGADPSPSLYGEETLPVCGETDPLRDQTEMILMRRCVDGKIPFLAICRGFEIMMAAAGGTLYQDVETQRPGSVFHPRYEVPADQVHGVTVLPGTLLYGLTGRKDIRVNSRHHQGAKDIPDTLLVSALAEDGLPEGIELPGHPFALGVQWHPETLSSAHPEAQRLFDGLCQSARNHHEARP